MRPRARFPLFDSLRAIAALSVVAYHASYYVGGLDGPVGRYATQRASGFPVIGVVTFFVISGFLLYRPFVAARRDAAPEPALVPYTVRRLLRIVPAYWLALPVVALVLARSDVFGLSGAATYFGFAQVYDLRTLNGGVGQAWTLDVELTFYAALPLLALALRRRLRGGFLRGELGLCVALFIGSIAWQALIIANVSTGSNAFYPALLALPAAFDFFALGMTFAVLSVAWEGRSPALVRIVDRAPWLPWLAALSAYWALLHSAGWFAGDRTLAWLATHELRGLIAVGLLLPAVFGDPQRGWVRRLLGVRALRWTGKVSYGVYLWHVVVLIELHDAGVTQPVVFLFLALTSTLALAAASWYGLERHAIALGHRLGRRERLEPVSLAN